MNKKRWGTVLMISLFMSVQGHASDLKESEIQRIIQENHLKEKQVQQLRAALKRAKWATQGYEPGTEHPMTTEECENRNVKTKLLKGGQEDIQRCGYPNMARVPSNDGGSVCIDRYEFPNLACHYPVTWVQPNEAAAICESMGKRLCDAHEWEASCANKPQPEDWNHPGNARREKVWAYGSQRDPSLCAIGGKKTARCQQAIEKNQHVLEECGSNTWPAGSFPSCASELGVYDLHGNAAEHMNLARKEKESGKKGGHGVTEMKGSWFAFSRSNSVVHEDDCTWRAPGWHRTEVTQTNSHANYHLSFRCCADVPSVNASSQ